MASEFWVEANWEQEAVPAAAWARLTGAGAESPAPLPRTLLSFQNSLQKQAGTWPWPEITPLLGLLLPWLASLTFLRILPTSTSLINCPWIFVSTSVSRTLTLKTRFQLCGLLRKASLWEGQSQGDPHLRPVGSGKGWHGCPSFSEAHLYAKGGHFTCLWGRDCGAKLEAKDQIPPGLWRIL